MTLDHRPLTARQQAELKGYVAPAGVVFRAVLFCGMAAALGGFLRYVVTHARPGAHFLWWVVPTVAVMAPWTTFEVLEAPESRIFFGLHKLDAPLKPSFVRRPFDGVELKRYCCRHYRRLDEEFERLKVNAAATQALHENTSNP